MFNWNVVEKTYVYDGTFEGLLTIVFDCYIKKVITNTRINNKLYSDCMSNNDSFR